MVEVVVSKWSDWESCHLKWDHLLRTTFNCSRIRPTEKKAQPVWNLLTLSSDRFQGPWFRKANNEPWLHFNSFVQGFVYELGKPNTSRSPCCVLLGLSWKTTNENPSTDKLSRAINYKPKVFSMLCWHPGLKKELHCLQYCCNKMVTRRPLLWALLVLCLGSRGAVRIHLQIGGRAGLLTNSGTDSVLQNYYTTELLYCRTTIL